MPDARSVLIESAVHGTCYWQPGKFTSAVMDFLFPSSFMETPLLEGSANPHSHAACCLSR